MDLCPARAGRVVGLEAVAGLLGDEIDLPEQQDGKRATGGGVEARQDLFQPRLVGA